MAFGLTTALSIAQTDLTPVVRPGKNPLQFGAVLFSTEEVPDLMNIGAAEQMVATHDLPGGGRVLNAYGNKPKDVSWSGRFWGPNIKSRVQQLRAYQVNGSEELLSFWFEQYYGIITAFDPGYKGGYNEYAITIEITRDANGAFTVASPLSIDQQVVTLQNQMSVQNNTVAALDAAGAAAFQQSLQGVNAAIAAASPISQNPTQAQNIITAITAAQTGVTSYLGTLSESAPQFVSTTQLSSTLTNMQALVQNGSAPNTTVVQGVSLFALAGGQYSDPSQAFTLAQANGLIVPFVSRSQQQAIVLPQLSATG